MRFVAPAVVFAFLFAGFAPAQDAAVPTVKLPVELKVKQGTLGELKADTVGKAVEWYAPGLDTRTCDGGKTLLFAGPDGTYTVLCYTAAGDIPSKASKCVVTIGGGGPSPTPPDPKPPDPKPPVDPLRAKLRLAFDASAGTAAQKVEGAKNLAALYRAAADLTADATISTAGQLRTKLSDASRAMVKDALLEVRKAVAGELAAVLPTVDGDLTDAQRAAAVALFKQLALALDAIASE